MSAPKQVHSYYITDGRCSAACDCVRNWKILHLFVGGTSWVGTYSRKFLIEILIEYDYGLKSLLVWLRGVRAHVYIQGKACE